MGTTTANKVNDIFDPDAVEEAAVQIARTPCPQTELYEREPQILRAIREFYRPAFERRGCATWIDDYGNLIATQGDGGGGPDVMLLSYAMAWTEGTMRNPWSGEILDGSEFGVGGKVVWGRGGSEYHPSNAALLECARIINELGAPFNGRITYVVSSAGHTSSTDPIYHLFHNDQLKPDVCLIPGSFGLVLGNMGRIDLRVNVYGKSVHSGGDIAVGLNAIDGGLEAISRVGKIMPHPPKGVSDPDMGPGRLSLIGVASYPFSPGYHNGVGSGGHTLQNLMRFLLDRRLPPGQDVDEAIAEIEDALGDMSPWRITLERGALQYPTKHSIDAPLMRGLARSFEAALGKPPTPMYIDYTIDAGYLNMLGIPTVMFGAMDMRFAHGDADFTQLQPTCEIARVYTHWALSQVGALSSS